MIHVKMSGNIRRAFDQFIEAHMQVRHYASYSIHPGCNKPTVAVKRDYFGPQKIFLRPDYTYKEAEATAMWLNERGAGYPVPASLEHLYGSQRDARITDGRPATRQDIGRSGRRRKAPR